MSVEEEVVKIGKKLEKMVANNTTDHSSAVDLLKKLKELKITLNVLTKTRIGMTVNNFRKACNKEEVVSLSKGLIKGWKKLLPADAPPSRSGSIEQRRESSGGSPVNESQNEQDSPNSEVMETEAAQKMFTLASTTNDPTRLKCRELLMNALKLTENLEGTGDPEELGAQIEDYIFQEFKNTESKYKNRVRSRVANLRDKKNTQLRENVLLGAITTEKIAKMTSEEMANDDMKKLRERYTKEAIDDHQIAKNSGTTTDLFKCGKCQKKNCTYTQLQTRSSDEPMTTFVFCNECGNRWKFC